jgi:DNA-binding beta-propeller fold protein YncE
MGDLELGVKYRFLSPTEEDWSPQAAIYPLLEVPTGNAQLGLGTGHTQLFVPIWLQKDIGLWTVYGGGGYFLNPGADNRNHWFSGLVVERKINDRLALGLELFHQTSSQRDMPSTTGYNIDGSYSPFEHLHFLAGRWQWAAERSDDKPLFLLCGTTGDVLMTHRLASNAITSRLLGVAVAMLIGLGAPDHSRAQSQAALEIERTIPLKDVTGRIDHMAIDLGRKRLFVAELGNGAVDVIDLAAGKVIHRIEGLKEPQGVGYAPGADVLAVASAGDGSVRLFRGAELQPAGIITLGDDADNVRLDARTGNFVVGYGSGGLAVIDPVKASVASRVALPAHPEGFRLDAEKRRAFVNVPDARQIAVVDIDAGRQSGSWQMPSFRSNFPMALDPAHGMAAVVFRKPGRLVIFDINAGTPSATVTTCGDADDVFFDTKRRRVYLSCGDGNVDAWQQDGSILRHLNLVKTASGARTSLFVPDLDRLFVAARAGYFGFGSDAAILVMRPSN